MRHTKDPLVELKQHRRVFGNNDDAINRHSVRLYRHGNRLYSLNKTLDTLPPIYTLSEVPLKDGQLQKGFHLLHTVLVNGEQGWGESLSWAKAERVVMNFLEAAGISRDTKTVLDA